MMRTAWAGGGGPQSELRAATGGPSERSLSLDSKPTGVTTRNLVATWSGRGRGGSEAQGRVMLQTVITEPRAPRGPGTARTWAGSSPPAGCVAGDMGHRQPQDSLLVLQSSLQSSRTDRLLCPGPRRPWSPSAPLKVCGKPWISGEWGLWVGLECGGPATGHLMSHTGAGTHVNTRAHTHAPLLLPELPVQTAAWSGAGSRCLHDPEHALPSAETPLLTHFQSQRGAPSSRAHVVPDGLEFPQPRHGGGCLAPSHREEAEALGGSDLPSIRGLLRDSRGWAE